MSRDYHLTMDHRMFDFHDFYIEVCRKMPNPCIVAEVGLADGASSVYLAEMLFKFEKQFKLWAIDSMDYGGYDQLRTLLHHYHRANLTDVLDVVTLDSLTASCRFEDSYFDFVFIDASHKYELTKADIRLWWHKVKRGGILAGHDYHTQEVKRAVDEVVPKALLRVADTSKQYGVWWMEKDSSVL